VRRRLNIHASIAHSSVMTTLIKKRKKEETNSWPSYGVSEGEERGGADECQHRSEVSYLL